MNIPGYATAAGTKRYAERHEKSVAAGHFRSAQGLCMSSLGLGTYLGNHDAEADRLYQEAIVTAVQLGCNVLDTAINYRCQRSERSIGAALRELAAAGYGRDEIVVASKGGFLPFDGTPPSNARAYFDETFVKAGILEPGDIVANCHCMAPGFILDQLDRSLDNCGLDCLDIYYLHNPETQLGGVPREEFNRRLAAAFEALEGAVQAGKLRMYGLATWNGYRSELGAKDYLNLREIHELAAHVAGRGHHFKVIQLPLNLAMTEALSLSNQAAGDKTMTILEAAQSLGVTVMCSASILQGQLSRNLPQIIQDTFLGLETDGQRSLQFVRSTPGVTTALVGMKHREHVEENLRVARVPPAPWEQYCKLFQPAVGT